MGFRIPQREANVTFEGTDFDGAEARLRLSAPMRLLFEFQNMDPTDPKASEHTIRTFGEKILLGWNLEDEQGVPVPATAEGLLEQPMEFSVALFRAWAEAASGIPAPLDIN